jgi:hypothetical protein
MTSFQTQLPYTSISSAAHAIWTREGAGAQLHAMPAEGEHVCRVDFKHG